MAEALDNLEVQYTYHEHKDSAGNVTTEEYLSDSGGCYTQKQERKETTPILCSRNGYVASENAYNNWGYCSKCGGEVYLGPSGGNMYGKYISHTHSLGYYYYLGCGKTTDTIESATIIY